jgi:hypothetical protein
VKVKTLFDPGSEAVHHSGISINIYNITLCHGQDSPLKIEAAYPFEILVDTNIASCCHTPLSILKKEATCSSEIVHGVPLHKTVIMKPE